MVDMVEAIIMGVLIGLVEVSIVKNISMIGVAVSAQFVVYNFFFLELI